jgi:hypothetical protein
LRTQGREREAAAGLYTRLLAILVFAAALLAGAPVNQLSAQIARGAAQADQARGTDAKGLRSGAPELRQRAIHDHAVPPPPLADAGRPVARGHAMVAAARPIRLSCLRLARRAVTVAQPRAPPILT